tara:strand:+ start:1839 stop:3890 length:2052 start_codon:yes stop_codon:yes gene_type:complete
MAEIEEMDETTLKSIVSSEITDALNHFDSHFSEDRLQAQDYYMGEELGNEVEGRSSVISTEFADTVESIMPSLMRVFTANDKYVRFNARTQEDVEKADQISDYVNYIINHDNEGYRILHDWFKDALMFRLGVVKFYYEEEDKVDEEEYNNLSESELAMLLENPDIAIVSQEETVVESFTDNNGEEVPIITTYNLVVRVTEKKGKIKITNVPPEEFLVNRRATSLEDAYFVCHRTSMTVSELVSMGYDREEVEAFAGESDLSVDEERTNRFGDIEATTGTDASDPTLKEVMYYESIINIDFDGDGIAERRRVCSIGADGSHILFNEPFDHVPFAVVSPILMQHRLVGRSVFDMTKDLQVIKSTLLRQYLDSVYTSTLPRMEVVEGMANIDDVLDGTAGGIIRVRQSGAVRPITGTQVGGEVRPLMDYVDEIKEQRTGMSKASMGLDANALQSTTASAIAATVRGAQIKLESYARNMAETGVKSLYKGLLHLVTKFDNKPRIVRLRNTFVPIDPREWTSEFDVVVQVGLGTADDEQKIAFLTQIAAKQEQILVQMGANNPLVSMEQYVNTLRSIAEIGGFKDADLFFNNPQQIAMSQAQQAQQAQQPPQPDPATIQAQAEIELKKQEAEADIALKREKMMMEIELQREKMQMEMQLRQQELQMESELRVAKAVTDSQISTNLPRV